MGSHVVEVAYALLPRLNNQHKGKHCYIAYLHIDEIPEEGILFLQSFRLSFWTRFGLGTSRQ